MIDSFLFSFVRKKGKTETGNERELIMAMSFNALRVGHTYRLRNYDDVREFTVLRRLNEKNFIIQDRGTLEKFELEDLVRYGRGKDFDLDEINQQGEII